MRKLLLGFVFSLVVLTMNAQVGTWKTYLAYADVTEIEQAGNIIYVLASNDLYTYNSNDESIQTYDKVNFLNDTQISHIAWCQAAHRLVIVYTNNNIDFLDSNNAITNLSAYRNKSMTVDKTINSINVDDIYAYLCTGFGIVKVNVRNAEISDTYNLGMNIEYSYISDGCIYAASKGKGIYKGVMTDNLLDKNNWTRTANYVAQTKTVDPELKELVATLEPGGPKYNYFHSMKLHNGNLYTTGGRLSGGVNRNRPGCIQILNDAGEWSFFEDNLQEKTGIRYNNISGLAIDPTDNRHTIAFGQTGVYEFYDGVFTKNWNIHNSPLQWARGLDPNNTASHPNYVEILGGIFDENGNFWCLNSYAENASIFRMTPSGEWTSFHHNDFMVYDSGIRLNRSLGSMENMMFDRQGTLWFVNNHWDKAAICAYDIDNDQLKFYSSFINDDGTKVETQYIRCVCEDKDGNLWIATDMGPVYLDRDDFDEDPSSVRFQQVKVPRNDGTNLADYLLSGVDIQCMAVDGGNRKWFGTGGAGLYLISSDNLEQVHHFTASDSGLLSDNIESIVINDKTGEVFIGTDKGLCSFMSDATETAEEMTKDNVWAYPNPVRPDYNGLITVTGLTYNAWVKITTANGVVVNEGQSNGGTYTWDGCDQDGRRVASGVYMVLTATEDQEKGVVCKIAIVR